MLKIQVNIHTITTVVQPETKAEQLILCRSSSQQHHISGEQYLQSTFIRSSVQTRIYNIVQNREVLTVENEKLKKEKSKLGFEAWENAA